MAIACICKNISAGELSEHLEKAARPVDLIETHDSLGTPTSTMCGQCRSESGKRNFVEIVSKHNKDCVPKLIVA